MPLFFLLLRHFLPNDVARNNPTFDTYDDCFRHTRQKSIYPFSFSDNHPHVPPAIPYKFGTRPFCNQNTDKWLVALSRHYTLFVLLPFSFSFISSIPFLISIISGLCSLPIFVRYLTTPFFKSQPPIIIARIKPTI